MPAANKNLSGQSIPQLVTHSARSSNGLVRQALEAARKGDARAFEDLANKAANSDAARLIASMVSSSEKHMDALLNQASAIGSAGKFTRGVLLLALGAGALLAAKGALGLAALLLPVIGAILLVCGAVSCWDALMTDSLEKIFNDFIRSRV